MQRIIYIGISYIRQNALKHLSALYMQHGFESLFYKCIFLLPNRGGIWVKVGIFCENPWFSSLHKSRERWACVLVKKNFHVGLQHGEDIKNIFEISKNENTGLS